MHQPLTAAMVGFFMLRMVSRSLTPRRYMASPSSGVWISDRESMEPPAEKAFSPAPRMMMPRTESSASSVVMASMS